MAAFRWCPFWPLVLLCSLPVPSELSFMVAGLRLNPTRVILLVAFIPASMRLVSGKAGRMHLMDHLIFLCLIWSFIVIGYHHGLSVALQSGGINLLELGGGYLIARVWILKERDYRGAMIVLVALMCLLAPFVLIESITGMHIIKTIASGHTFHSEIGSRMGLTRAYGPFDHPIHLGVIAASTLGIIMIPALPKLGAPKQRPFLKYGILISALSSLSSGGIFTLGIQTILLFWNRLTRTMRSRWIKLTLLIMCFYAAIELLSNRSGVIVLLSYLTFSVDTAYNRVMIFDWGMNNFWSSPLLGIGFNDWARPDWVFSSSMDNFWLVNAVTFGFPGFFLLALSTLLMVSKGWKELPSRILMLRTGWAISMLGLIFAATTVHLWNNLYVYFSFMLGAGAWFHNIKRTNRIFK
jgi:hypothetical protein